MESSRLVFGTIVPWRLRCAPAAVQAIALTAAELHRPVEHLSIRDVEKRC